MADAQANLAQRIKNYQVGNATGIVVEQPTVHIGYGGVPGAGKSAYINRTYASVRGAYEELSMEVPMSDLRQADPGTLVEHRLTDHIKLVEVRTMKDFDKAEIDSLLGTIQGKQPAAGQTLQIHCPVFIYMYTEFTLEVATKFLSEISMRVNEIYGRNIMIAVIQEVASVADAERVRNEICSRTNIPLDNIWVFERSSPENAVTDEQRNKMLRFTWACLKLGELNIQFWVQNERKTQQMEIRMRTLRRGVGGGVGGAAGAGALSGLVAGPVGAAIGAVIGAAAGGFAGALTSYRRS